MYLRKIKSAPCQPVTLEDVRRSLAIDSSSVSEDSLIDLLIASATSDAEMKTGRIFVESEWEWKPEKIGVGEVLEFPTCPVTKVQAFTQSDPLTDISGDLFDIVYPSPEPQGTPMLGWLLPTSAVPSDARIVLTVGYPYETLESPVEQKDNPELDTSKTGYTSNSIHLVFSRPVRFDVVPENFRVSSEGAEIAVTEVVSEKDGITLVLERPLEQQARVSLSFIEGVIYDDFGNLVQPIFSAELPLVVYANPESFQEPPAVPVEISYKSLCPAPVKQWILVRIGTLYSQRTEIALRAGRSNDALYPDGFINNLLNPYRTRYA